MSKKEIYKTIKLYKNERPYLHIDGYYFGKIGSTISIKKAVEKIESIHRQHHLIELFTLAENRESDGTYSDVMEFYS